MTNTKGIALAAALMIATGAMASNANAAMISPFQTAPVVAEMAAPNANLHVVKFGDRFKKWGKKIGSTVKRGTKKAFNPKTYEDAYKRSSKRFVSDGLKKCTANVCCSEGKCVKRGERQTW